MLKRFFRRLLCPHLQWYEDLFWEHGWRLCLVRWRCYACDKAIVRDENNPPINFFHC